MIPADARKVHFVGIGGAGMSAIAKVLLEKGLAVAGSDLKPSRAASMLQAMGATVSVGHDAALVEDADALVVSTAIPPTNPEVRAAVAAGIPVISRGEALASVLADRRAVIVAGTHGKTTTTSMIVTILRSAHVDPTYLIGGGLNESGTNARFGSDQLAVAESDESDGSFLLLQPDIAVVTNVEMDHIDHWGSLDSIYGAFAEFLARVRAGGACIVPSDDARLLESARSTCDEVVTTGQGGDVFATNVSFHAGRSRFDLTIEGDRVAVDLPVPGAHNVANAVSAAAAAHRAGVSAGDIANGLGRYRGVERRFQMKGIARGVTIIDDYAHHPTEVRATLAAARSARDGRVVAVFQPHRYSRTAAFADEFGAAFEDADSVLVMDVYGAGEEPVPGVSGKLVSDAVCEALPGRPVAYLGHRAEAIAYLERALRPGDVVLTLGAGDVTTVGDELLGRLEQPA